MAKPVAPGRSTIVTRWKVQPPSLRVLRAFLGATFVFAGMQKLADPNFWRAGTPDFIGAQLHAFAGGTPIGWLLRIAAHAPVLTGLLVAIGELAIGVGTLVGIAPVAFAAGGLAINVILMLSATWHVHPYFLGSDSIYAIAWAAYLMGLVEVSRREGRHQKPVKPSLRAAARAETTRREVLRGGLVAGMTVLLSGVAALLAGPPKRLLARSADGSNAANGSSPSGSPSAGASPPASHSGATAAGIPLDKIPVGGAVGFRAPGGDPAVLVRLGTDSVVAYSRVCTHAGCLVQYDRSSRILFCPCHGAEFDPANGARPIAGPAFDPLPRVDVRIDESTKRVIT